MPTRRRNTTESSLARRCHISSAMMTDLIARIARSIGPQHNAFFLNATSLVRSSALALVHRAILLESTAAQCIEQLSIEDVDWQQSCHWLDDLADAVDVHLLHAAVREELLALVDQPLTDPFAELHLMYRSAEDRRSTGEVYTPAWLADAVVDSVWQAVWQAGWQAGRRWLDPTSGGGAFILALARQSARHQLKKMDMVCWDRSPWAVLASAAALQLARFWLAGGRPARDKIRVGQVDALNENRPNLRVDFIVGNPPWILWDQFLPAKRDAMRSLWQTYSLQCETGMASILGGGKRDVASLILLANADHHLEPGGRLAMVVPQSLFKSTASARGLRRWQLPDGTPLAVERVDDLSLLNPFPDHSVKTAVVHIKKSAPTIYPVRYRIWTRKGHVEEHLAQPTDTDDPLSAWTHLERGATAKRSSKSEYVAHLGVNTGGMSGVYWFRKIREESPDHWHVINLGERGKKSIPSREVLLESRFLFPVLLGKDVRAWHAEPSAWILFVQDPDRRRGLQEGVLEREAPRTWEYLHQHEAQLRQRAAFKRYFQKVLPDGSRRDTGPFYSMFNVGPYTLAPFKVVWNRMGRRLSAAVVSQADGQLVLPQETHGFIGVESLAEADYLAALLNSAPVRQQVESNVVASSKSLATPRVIHQLGLVRFRSEDGLHAELADQGRQYREAAGLHPDLLPHSHHLDELAKLYWSQPGEL